KYSEPLRDINISWRDVGDVGKLEDWIFRVQQRFSTIGIGTADVERRIADIRNHWDRDLDNWWEDVRGMELAPLTWERFLELLRTTFTPVGEAKRATNELTQVKQGGGETMDAY